MGIRTLDELEVIEPLKVSNYVKNDNMISDLGFKPFSERTKNLIDSFNKSIDKKYTEALGVTCYNFEDLTTETFYSDSGCPIKTIRHSLEYRGDELVEPVIYKGVYKFDDISNFIGEIPEKNQREIKRKYDGLNSNPFVKVKFRLIVLAPLNNFADENNISAIDPIVFAYFYDNYLLPLTWWV